MSFRKRSKLESNRPAARELCQGAHPPRPLAGIRPTPHLVVSPLCPVNCRGCRSFFHGLRFPPEFDPPARSHRCGPSRLRRGRQGKSRDRLLRVEDPSRSREALLRMPFRGLEEARRQAAPRHEGANPQGRRVRARPRRRQAGGVAPHLRAEMGGQSRDAAGGTAPARGHRRLREMDRDGRGRSAHRTARAGRAARRDEDDPLVLPTRRKSARARGEERGVAEVGGRPLSPRRNRKGGPQTHRRRPGGDSRASPQLRPDRVGSVVRQGPVLRRRSPGARGRRRRHARR